MDAHTCPVGFVVATTFASVLVWLIAMINQMPMP
jgi:hypothetical protein